MAEHILVTGGAGYIGSILCGRLCEEGYRVTAVDNLTGGPSDLLHLCHHPLFEFVYGDVREEEIMRHLIKAADVIIPLAAVVGAPACDRSPLLAREVNLEAVRLMERLRSRDQLVIFPTTQSGYGTRSGEVYCDEETPLEPISLYGQTKVQAEAELLGSGGVITLRLATVFGVSPRMRWDLLLNHFVHAAVHEGYIIVFEKDYKRNFVHIRDVADCFVHCLKNAEMMAGRAFNVGSDSANVTKEEMALKVKEQVPEFYVHFASVGSDPDKRNYIVSNQRLRKEGFEARRTLDEGIRELLKASRLMGPGPKGNS